ncbi:MAG: hypothetical protein PHD01_09060, partial [Geobacteraceae bacterium]|nr:hypothetical protein [Geobacteraceae bacterium]
LAAHFLSTWQEILVKSAFEMSPESRRTVFRLLHGLTVRGKEAGDLSVDGDRNSRCSLEADIAEDRRVRFEVDPSLVCGIEIRSGGRSLAWNIEDYLGEMEQRLLEAIE